MTAAARRERHYVRIIVGTLVILALPFGLHYFPSFFQPSGMLFPGKNGQTIYSSPKGWVLQFPSSWDAQLYETSARGGPYRTESVGLWLSSMKQNFEFSTRESVEWFQSGRFPSTLIVLQAGFSYGGGFGIFCATDTKLPLKLRGDRYPQPILDSAGQQVRQVGTRFSVRGAPYNYVSAWVGSSASAADIKTMERIVQSISYELTGDREYGSHDCSEGPPRV